jgi:hypothetical protein
MGWLEQLLRRAAPGDVPADPIAGSVMSPNYVPQTSRRQLGLGALRGLLDVTPVGIADAVQSGINNMQSPVGAALRAVTGKAASPGDVLLGKLGLLGSGSGYDAGRFALNAAFPAMGLLGNQAGGALPKGYARNQAGAIVWHGSPHKFDRFDASKIGTGEGAQVYGHGLYLAESPEVARMYQKNTGRVYQIDTPNGRQPLDWDKPEHQAAALLHLSNRNRADALASPFQSQEVRDILNSGMPLPAVKIQDPSLYKVDLPDDQIAKMLDWDKPLSEQAPGVRSLIEQERKRIGGGASTGEQAYRELMFEARMQGDRSASNAMRNNAEALAASRRLQELGIPGIRYLDGGSRGTGSGTSNFVVFPGNEGLLNILERNGQPIR